MRWARGTTGHDRRATALLRGWGRRRPARTIALRWAALTVLVLALLTLVQPVGAQDSGTVDLNFARVTTVVWGTGTAFGEFQVDAAPGDSLNVSVEVRVSRNALTADVPALMRLELAGQGITAVSVQRDLVVGPESPARIVLLPLNVTLPSDAPDGDYAMVLTLDAGSAESHPQSDVMTIPVSLGERVGLVDERPLTVGQMAGAAILVALAVFAVMVARISGTARYQAGWARARALSERVLEAWTHHPRRGSNRALLTFAGVATLVVVLALAGFFEVPSGDLLLGRLVVGVLIGAIYALVAVGYTMVYGVLKFINFAHGEIFMWGAYAAFFLTVQHGMGFWPSVLGAVLFAAALGAGIERVAYRPLRGRPRLTPLITAIGVSLFLQGASQFVFSTKPQVFRDALERTAWGSGSLADALDATAVTVFGVPVQALGLLILVTAVATMAGLHAFIRYTRLGKAMRAVSDDFDTAAVIGINVNRVVTVTFAIGSGLAAIAGILFGMRLALTPTMGFVPGIKAFTAAVVGGIGNVYGAFLGGFVVGLAENVGGAFLRDRAFQDAIAFLLLIIVLIVRPTGLFAARESEVRRK